MRALTSLVLREGIHGMLAVRLGPETLCLRPRYIHLVNLWELVEFSPEIILQSYKIFLEILVVL
jgi:hypothetical protein